MNGLLIAAPSSGSGKTIVTLALLRALKRSGHTVGSLKIGPDYIDPGFHSLASKGPCLNIDSWAMRPTIRARQIARLGKDADLIIAEGVMGLFDGAADGSGSSADLPAHYPDH
jgi:cobyrinic acid a,c-diamide synthase